MPGPYSPVTTFLSGLVTAVKMNTVKKAIDELQADRGRIGATVYKAASATSAISGGGTNIDIARWDLADPKTVNYGGVTLADSATPMTVQAGFGGTWLIQLVGNLSVSPVTSGYPLIRNIPADQFVGTPGIQPGQPLTAASLPYFDMMILARLPDGAQPIAAINQVSGGSKNAQAWFSMYRIGD